jgi:hypothetical protein
MAQHLYTKMSVQGDIQASSVVSLFAVEEIDRANPIYEEVEEDLELPGPPPLPETGDTLNAVGERPRRPFSRNSSPTSNRTTPFNRTGADRASNQRRPFQARPGAANLSQDTTGRAQTASLFGAEATTERQPNLVGPTVPQLDQHGKPYKCYNCGRPNHIASGCRYQPVDGEDGDKPRSLRRVTAAYAALDWVHVAREQGTPDHFQHEAYCMWLHEAIDSADRLTELSGINSADGN